MDKRKVRKMKPYSREWEREANKLARNSIKLRPCGLCGHPLIEGYICPVCYGDDSVDDDDE